MNLFRLKLNSYSTDKWWNVPVVKHWKSRETWNCHSQDHPRLKAACSIRFYPSPVTQKEHRIWHTMGEERIDSARHSLTNTRKVSRNVHEPDIRATGLLHFRVQLNRPRGSTVVLWNYRKTRERRFYFAISWSKLPARSLLPCRLFNLETQG